MKTISTVITAILLTIPTIPLAQDYSTSSKEISNNTTYHLNAGVAVGATDAGDMTYRFAIAAPWNVNWLNSTVGYVSGYWDFGYTYWEGGDAAAGNHSLAVAPVFTYNFNTNSQIKPYIEVAIGVAAFSRTRVSNKKLGSAFNFEDRLGLGITFLERQKLGVRVMHYSNGGIKKPNQGVNNYSLFYSYAF
ncbi:acyloxyacyl hydrolase [Entomomonas asaccharolytica]|uniref:Lipid A deacylase n=1 Tax=Entomomonas asaccharolytica TaxID=2785331 RepID=A0A974RX46_9GAMM|nr:acyloxyacyl hydrolase [Entomomonas asaccharolytica]QQP85822.1 acyloxyacyl hydrolase [Entomomonas asaccharolytica]